MFYADWKLIWLIYVRDLALPMTKELNVAFYAPLAKQIYKSCTFGEAIRGLLSNPKNMRNGLQSRL